MITNPDIFPYIKGIHLQKIPIPTIKINEQKLFVNLVDRILHFTKDEDYQNNSGKQAAVGELEREIDQIVYQLYGLTEEEIATVEGKR